MTQILAAELNGIEGIKVLRRHFPAARIVIVSGTSHIDVIPPDARRDRLQRHTCAGDQPCSRNTVKVRLNCTRP